MPSFEYQAVNPMGQAESGTVLGMNLADAVQQLAGKGLKVEKISVAEQLAPPTGNPYDTPETVSAGEPSGPPPPTDQRSYFATSVAGPLVGRVFALGFALDQLHQNARDLAARAAEFARARGERKTPQARV